MYGQSFQFICIHALVSKVYFGLFQNSSTYVIIDSLPEQWDKIPYISTFETLSYLN